ncbi:MAG: 3-keto-5-aminohexanoate cleavage protein [Acidobacteria bacterium]|nr:3-keto-5-aminohexanoate cleavage protein [Acidobacteriota bacterium]
MTDKLIITSALTGAITIPTQTPHLPFTPEHLIADAIACGQAGAAAVHVHARDPVDGRPLSDPDLFEPILKGIKAASNVVTGVTTGGGMGMSPQDRLRVIPRYRPELASFNLGSINFSMHPVAKRYKPGDYKYDWEQSYVEGTKDFIFRNTFGDMETYSSTFAENNVRPEFEAYDLGHLYNLRFLVKNGLAKPPLWIQFVLGVLGGLAATIEDLIVMKQTADRLFGSENYKWSVIGVGYPAEINLAATAIMMGGHVRVGLEDNIFIGKGRYCTNAQLVEKIVRLAHEFDRDIATPEDMRQILGLKGAAAIGF